MKQVSREQLDAFEICSEIDKCLHRLEFDDILAVATSRLHIQAMPLHQNIFCFDSSQNIQNYLNIFMIRSDYPNRRAFNNVLKGFITSGIVSKWAMDARRYSETSIRHFDVHSINITEFYFAFIFAMVFISLSITALIFEFIIHFKCHSRNSKYYWTFLDRIISGKRNFLLLEPKNDCATLPFTH